MKQLTFDNLPSSSKSNTDTVKSEDLNLYLTTICSNIFREYSNKTPRSNNRQDDTKIMAEFYPYTNLKLSVRRRNNMLLIRMSDILSDAPEGVLVSAANIIISKQLNIKPDKNHKNQYRDYIFSENIRSQLRNIRQKRCRKRIIGSEGKYHDLEKYFDNVNLKYFEGRLSKPNLTWSTKRSQRRLGHYDSDLNTLVVSRYLDSRNTPQYVVEYIVYHELLHQIYKGRFINGRWYVHTPEFKLAEKEFNDFLRVKKWIKKK